MADDSLTPEQYLRGLGFAFFRWHHLRWGGEVLCSGWLHSPNAMCVREWMELNP